MYVDDGDASHVSVTRTRMPTKVVAGGARGDAGAVQYRHCCSLAAKL